MPVTVVLLKNCTSHSPGLHEMVAAPPAESGAGDGIGALTGPLAKAGVNASAARDDPFFGRYVASMVWVPALRTISVSAVSVSVSSAPEPCLKTRVPSIDIDATSSPVEKKV